MMSAQYKCPISSGHIVCDLVNEESQSYWVYRDTGKKVSCSTMKNQREALEWFAHVYQEMKPIFTLK